MRRLLITLSNVGNGVDVVEVTPLAYRKARARRHRLEPGASIVDVWDLRGTHHWYDFQVSGALGFQRRFAGHGENGRPSFSDPLLGRQT